VSTRDNDGAATCKVVLVIKVIGISRKANEHLAKQTASSRGWTPGINGCDEAKEVFCSEVSITIMNLLMSLGYSF